MKLTYRPELDGLRALAVLLVLATHAHFSHLGGAFIGVDLFFVLSGFLITNILMGRPKFGDFWIRRLQRLAPALFALCAVYAVVAPRLPPGVFPYPKIDLLGALTWSTNLLLPFLRPTTMGLGHTWSLGVEMQFYLVWPFVVAGLLRCTKPVAIGILGALYLLGLGVRVMTFLYQGPAAANFFPWAHATGLILGALLAFLPPPRRFTQATGCSALAVIAAIAWTSQAVAGGVVGDVGAGVDHLWRNSLAEFAGAALLTALRTPSTFTRAFAWEPLRRIGVLSYGIYLWHFPIEIGLRDYAPPLMRFAIGFSASTLLAALSYATIEALFRKRRVAAPSSEPALAGATAS